MTLRDNLDKRFEDSLKKQTILSDIIRLINEKPINISELSRKLNLNRSTLRYYINLLRAEHKIIIEKREDEIGKPVYIKINKEHFEKEWQKGKKETRERMIQILKSPSFNFVFKLIKEKKELSEEEFRNIIAEKDKEFFKNKKSFTDLEVRNNITFASAISNIILLKNLNYIKEKYEITPQGEKFFNEFEKRKEKEVEKYVDYLFPSLNDKTKLKTKSNKL